MVTSVCSVLQLNGELNHGAGQINVFTITIFFSRDCKRLTSSECSELTFQPHLC